MRTFTRSLSQPSILYNYNNNDQQKSQFLIGPHLTIIPVPYSAIQPARSLVSFTAAVAKMNWSL